MDMARKDMGDLVLFEQRQQFGGQLRAQAVMILTTPGIKEGDVEKNQPGPGGLGFLSSASSQLSCSWLMPSLAASLTMMK